MDGAHPRPPDRFGKRRGKVRLRLLRRAVGALGSRQRLCRQAASQHRGSQLHAKISASDYEATLRYDLHNRLEGMKPHKKVLHGDYCPSNVIVTPDGRYYIIDWAHATQGNASADAARTYLTFTLSGQIDVAEKYLALFCKKADIPKQLVQQWMPIVACSESTKHIPGEREVLDRWVNVFDFQ